MIKIRILLLLLICTFFLSGCIMQSLNEQNNDMNLESKDIVSEYPKVLAKYVN